MALKRKHWLSTTLLEKERTRDNLEQLIFRLVDLHDMKSLQDVYVTAGRALRSTREGLALDPDDVRAALDVLANEVEASEDVGAALAEPLSGSTVEDEDAALLAELDALCASSAPSSAPSSAVAVAGAGLALGAGLGVSAGVESAPAKPVTFDVAPAGDTGSTAHSAVAATQIGTSASLRVDAARSAVLA